MSSAKNKQLFKASKEHLELSTYIKEVHKQLRNEAKSKGWKETWENHINNTNMLKKYATSMEDLACKHWQQTQEKINTKALSRITWIYEKCQNYFKNAIFKCRQQENDIAQKCEWTNSENILQITDKLKLLDVGSCYNPFQKYDDYVVLAIDIAPSNKDVKQCDFLNIKISESDNTQLNVEALISNDVTCTNEFVKESFHIVVFSLLLDYFPTPDLRLKCCKNAYDLLTFEGILVIISPDAKHVGANAKFMKSWRHILAQLGFRRVVYEKLQYLHCMVFRKCNNPEIAKRWSILHKDDTLYKEMFIPQDFNVDDK